MLKTTSLKPTSVQHSLSCTHNGQEYLVFTKGNTLVIQSSTFNTTLDIQGRIRSLKHIDQYLILWTHKLSIMSLDVKNEFTIQVEDHARPSEVQSLLILNSFIVMYQSQGLLKLIPYKKPLKFETPYNVRLDKLDVIDLIAIQGTKLGVLYLKHHTKYLAIYTISKKGLELQSDVKVDEHAYKLVNVDTVGVVSTSHFVMGKTQVNWDAMVITAHCIFNNKILFCSDLGLFLVHSDGSLIHLSTEYTQVSTITYYDSKLFCGSHFGDSVLLEMQEDGLVEVERWECTSPITDFVILKSQEQTTVVTCSGYNESGSLRIVTNGIGIEQVKTLDLVAKRVFSVGDCVIASGVDKSWRLQGEVVLEEFDCAVLGAFLVGHVETIVFTDFIQVTINGTVRVVGVDQLLDSIDSEMIEIVVAMGGSVEFGCCFVNDQFIYVTLFDTIIVLEDLHLQYQIKASGEISCIHVQNDQIVVGLWSMELQVFENREEVYHKECVNVPRSIQGYKVGFGDGTLVVFDHQWNPKKTNKLGNCPLELVQVNQEMTIVSGERIWIHDESVKNVNVSNVIGNTTMINDQLVYISHGLKMGKMESMEKLHVKSIKLGETVRRVTKSGTHLVVLSSKNEKVAIYSDGDMPGSFGKSRVGYEYREKAKIKTIDIDSFETIDAIDLKEFEMGSCLCTAECNEPVVLVGTGFVNDQEEPTSGHIIVLGVQNGKMTVLQELQVNGCVYSLVEFQGKIAASIGNKVVLYEWVEDQLQPICTHFGHILALQLSIDKDDILVTDLMKSVSILKYDESTRKLVERFRDVDTHWMTAAEIKDDIVIGCDASYNLFMVQKSDSKLIRSGSFHLGDQVNKIKKGMLCQGNEIVRPEMVYVTVNGEIGMISKILRDKLIIEKLEEGMSTLIVHPFDLKPNEMFVDERTKLEKHDIFDGDLVAKFLFLCREEQEKVAEFVGKTVQDLVSLVQDLAILY